MLNPDGTFAEDISCIVASKNGTGAIFISNVEAACNPATLKKHGIGAVITAIKGKNLAEKIPKHIEYMYIPVIDHESCNISIFFDNTFEFIQEQRKRTNVLVHCMAGVSRSVTLVIAYIMQKSDCSFQSAFRYVKQKRQIINPNQAFIQQLIEHEKRLKMKNNQRSLQMLSNKISNRFESIQQGQIEMCKSNFQVKQENKTQDCLVYSKEHRFNKAQFYKTASSWTTSSGDKSTVFKEKLNKKSSGQNYDTKLRQSIKKLFNQVNLRGRQHDKTPTIR